ncbi:MAG: hypothetical protein KC435_12875 [Thermomicrobiales bacterium]|nr:hypothetical protein [Thermomicrobiales bacterium]
MSNTDKSSTPPNVVAFIRTCTAGRASKITYEDRDGLEHMLTPEEAKVFCQYLLGLNIIATRNAGDKSNDILEQFLGPNIKLQ